MQLAGDSGSFLETVIGAAGPVVSWVQGLPAQLGGHALAASLQQMAAPGFRQQPLQQALPVVRKATWQLNHVQVAVALHSQGMEPAAAAAKATEVCSSGHGAEEGDAEPTYPAFSAQRQRGINEFSSPRAPRDTPLLPEPEGRSSAQLEMASTVCVLRPGSAKLLDMIASQHITSYALQLLLARKGQVFMQQDASGTWHVAHGVQVARLQVRALQGGSISLEGCRPLSLDLMELLLRTSRGEALQVAALPFYLDKLQLRLCSALLCAGGASLAGPLSSAMMTWQHTSAMWRQRPDPRRVLPTDFSTVYRALQPAARWLASCQECCGAPAGS